MASFIVKITTKYNAFDLFCPHCCRGCGRIGTALCECCKNNININKINYCPKCHESIGLKKCEKCDLPFVMTFMVGWQDEVIGKLVKEYKYGSVRSLAKVLAELLDNSLPIFGEQIVVVPLSTVARHVRQRGLDHTDKIARELAKRRGFEVERVLERKKNGVQVGARAEVRKKQAKEAYQLAKKIDPKKTYLLFDDVWTTGASMTEAGKLMKKAGAKKIVAAVLAVNRGQRERRSFFGLRTVVERV